MATETPRKLDVGCGNNKREDGAVGMDLRRYDDVDLVYDIENTPWPFDDGTFERVLTYSVLEHVEDIPRVMAEIHRVSTDGATVTGKVPHWKDRHAYVDPTHCQLFDTRTFDYWDSTTEYGQLDYFDAEFRVEEARRIRRVKFWKSRPISFELAVVK